MIDRRQRYWLIALAMPAVSACAQPEAVESSAAFADTAATPDATDMSRRIAERMQFVESRRQLAAPSPQVALAAPVTGQQLVDALDIPAGLRPTFVSATIPDPDAVVVRNSYGRIQPKQGTSFLLMSTGRSNIDTLTAEPGTDMGPVGPTGDASTLRFQVTVPPGVNRMSFDFDFLSAESPDFVGSVFNDTFTAQVSDALGANRQVAFASVNTATFHPASDTNVGAGPFLLYVDDPSGVDTVFNTGLQLDAGATDYQHVDTVISGGASGVITIVFDIHDLGDGIFDSAVIIDNLTFSAMEIIDPRGDVPAQSLIDGNGQVLQAPDARLVTLGKPVQAVAADGATQVVLRSSVPGPGKATFTLPAGGTKDGSVSPASGSPSFGPSTTVDAQLIGGNWFAIALYRSPPDFNRGGDEASASRDAALTMTFVPTSGTGFVQNATIRVVRPPVIVVPDVFSDCLSWQAHGGLMDPNPAADPRESVQHPFTVTCADYQATSTKSLRVNQNANAIATAIDQALDALRTTGVAATRADVVAHGMGGILARRYIDDPSFLGTDNFNAGKINRLITMDTPHLGSRMADEIVQFRDFTKDQFPDVWTAIRDGFLAPNGINIDNDASDVAIDELGTASLTINSIGQTTRLSLPRSTFFHAMVSTGGRAVSRNDGLNLLPAGVQSLYTFMEEFDPNTVSLPITDQQQNLIFGTQSLIFCTDDQATGADDHDLFATQAEQQGGLADAFTSSFLVAPAAPHSGHLNVQQDKAHTDRLVALLNSSVTGGLFAPAMPPPEAVPRNNGCPLPSFAPAAPAARLAAAALAQHNIAISSPAPGTTVSPGSTISVAINTGGAQPRAILIASAGGVVRLEAPPFVASFQIPATAAGSLPLHAIAFFGQGQVAVAQPVNLNVNVNATLTAIEVLNGNVVLQRPGRTQQMRVIGTFSDGVQRDITQLTGTRYAASSLTPVASVSATGLISALGPGNATIAVSNGSLITSINAKVGAPTCGDGVVDPGEQCDDGNLADGDGCDPACKVSNLPPIAVCKSPTVCNDPGLCSANVTNLGAGSSDPEGHATSITQSPAGPYSVGPHEVSVGVSDGSLTSQCLAELDVRDCEKPALSCPANFTAECTGNGGALVTPPGTSATDNCGAPTVHAPAAGQLLLGANALTYTASDASGNVTSCTTTATVVDTIPPSIACPAPTVAECTGPRQATVDPGLASASDSCTPPTVTQPGAGTFPLGTTPVTYTASDSSANHASCETTVTVRDTTAPSIQCPAPKVAECTGNGHASVDPGNASAQDVCTSATVNHPGPASFALGQTSVQYTATDEAGNQASCATSVTVRDTTAPSIQCPAPKVAECTGNGHASVDPGSASAQDICTSATVNQPGAASFALGQTSVQYTATDEAGNQASCATSVTVQDTTPPSITCPAPTVAECTGPRQATVDPGRASASDSCTPPAVTQPGAGTFPLGTTPVTFTASDSSANHASCETTVTVRDTTAPRIACPAPTVAECTGNGQASVDPGSASAQDVCTSATVSHPGAASFALGQTSVQYTATDEAGNQASCAISVTVQDTTPPSIACPAPIVTECTSPQGAFIQPGQATSSDICTGVTVTGQAPRVFPRGTTTVTYTSSDTTGNTASCDSTISVVDTTPPTITVGHPAPLLPANHQYHTVSLDDCHIQVQDTCGGQLSPSTSHAEITCVTSNEPDNSHGDGNTINDIVILDDHTLKLRAERDGGGNGRVYNVHFRVKDQAGNPQDGVCSFVVPHDDRCGTGCRVDDAAVANSVCRH